MDDAFVSLTFQSCLGVGALLFGVFGFLYSVYAMNSNFETRPPIVATLRKLCRIIAILISANFLLSAYALYLMIPAGRPIDTPRTILASGLVIISLATCIISDWMSFKKME